MKEIPLYVKYNRARDGNLKEGDIAPNVPTFTLDGKPRQLLDGAEAKPVVIVGGSYS